MTATEIMGSVLLGLGTLAALAVAWLCASRYRASLTFRTSFKAKVRRFTKWSLWAASGLAFLALAGICSINCWGSAKLRRAIVQARAAGFPESVRSVDLPTIKDEENGAPYYLAAFELYSGRHKQWPHDGPYVGCGRRPGLCEPVSEELACELAAVVEEASDFYRLIAKAHEYPKCRFPVKWSFRDPLLITQAGTRARGAARMLQVRALHCQAVGEADEAISSCLQGLGCAAALRERPFLISHLVRITCHQFALESLEGSLSRCQPSEALLATMQNAILQEDASLSLKFAIRCEGAYIMDISRSMDAYLIAQRDRLLELEASQIERHPLQPPMDSAELKKLVRRGLMYSFLCRTLLPGSAKAWTAKRLSIALALHGLPGDPVGQQYLRLAEEPGSRSPEACAARAWTEFLKGHASLRVAAVALAAERFRIECGNWPASLSQLAPKHLAAVPLDPFDGKPLRYAAIPGGRVVYSTGPDREDGRGACWEKQRYPVPDITFALFDPAARNKPRNKQ